MTPWVGVLELNLIKGHERQKQTESEMKGLILIRLS